jgi:hypothetical protein
VDEWWRNILLVLGVVVGVLVSGAVIVFVRWLLFGGDGPEGWDRSPDE